MIPICTIVKRTGLISVSLNLIERLWKFVKSEVLNAAYIGSFVDFKNSIDECLDNLGSKYLPKMHSLITANFQLYATPDNAAVFAPVA